MAQNELAKTSKEVKFRTISEIMSMPSMKAKLTNLIDEAVISKVKIEDQQVIIKGLRTAALDDLGLKPALFNAYLAMVFNNDYVDRLSKLEELTTLVETVMSDAKIEFNSKDE